MHAAHKTITAFTIIFLFIAAHSKVVAQEICNNGKDDDNDGLIDLHDPDCQCRYKVNGNLLQNASFENFDHCPEFYIYNADHDNVLYWDVGSYVNINLTDFYHNLRCPQDSAQFMYQMAPPLPFPDGTGIVGLLNIPSIKPIPESTMTKSYVGQCLQAPLKKGESYTLSFYAERTRSWDDPIGKIFPFTIAVFGNADCNAVPFGKANVLGNGCPANYPGWVMLGKTSVYTTRDWEQTKITLTIPFDINVIQIGADCTILPPIIDQADSTTYLDYHLSYLDDLHLLPTKDFPFEYITIKPGTSCTNGLVLLAPQYANATYQWYKDSIAIAGATGNTYAVTDTTRRIYNAVITTAEKCITTEPFLVTKSRLSDIHIPKDTFLCTHSGMLIAPALDGITYHLNGASLSEVSINQPGHYTIIASDIYGCEKNFDITVAEQNCDECEVLVPTAFTPNGDMINDIFRAKLFCNAAQFNCQIFTRWGKKIFESNNVNNGWDGTFAGIKMPNGVYVYVMNYTTAGRRKTAKGSVVLLR